MKSAPGLRGLYPRPERRGFTPLSVSTLTSLLLRPKLKSSKVTRVGKRAFLGTDTRGVVAGLLPFFRRRRRTDMGDRRTEKSPSAHAGDCLEPNGRGALTRPRCDRARTPCDRRQHLETADESAYHLRVRGETPTPSGCRSERQQFYRQRRQAFELREMPRLHTAHG